MVKEDIIQQQILEAAKRLFQLHGLQKVTMDDVARAIGKGRSSLYYYYKSKDELFDAVLGLEISEMLAAMNTAVDQAHSSEQKIHAFFLAKLSVLQEKRAFFQTLDMGMDADAMSQFNKVKIMHHHQIIKKETVLLSRILNEGIQLRELRPMDKKEVESVVFVLLSALRGIKKEMVIENSFSKMKPAVATLTSLVMNGLKQ